MLLMTDISPNLSFETIMKINHSVYYKVLTRWTKTVIFGKKGDSSNNNHNAVSIVLDVWQDKRLPVERTKIQADGKPTKKTSFSHSLSIPPRWSSRANKWMGPDRIFKRLSGETENPHIRLVYETYPSLYSTRAFNRGCKKYI